MSIKIMNEVWERSQHSKGALLVMLAIADFADDRGRAFPSIETLALKTRQTERNVNLVLTKLVESEELTILPNKGPYGTNLYVINVDKLPKITISRRGEKISPPPEIISLNNPMGDEIISKKDEKISPDPSCDPSLKGINHPSMHAEPENSEPQPTQTGMDGCMDGIDREKFNFLWDCGLRSEKLINDLVELPMQTLEKEWALVKNSTNANDKPALLGRNLRIALTRFQIEQRQTAERAANPTAATPVPSNAHPDATRYQRPDFITEAEWYGLRDVHEVYELLDGATFDEMTGSLSCRTPKFDNDLFMKRNGASIIQRFGVIRNWQPQEDWA